MPEADNDGEHPTFEARSQAWLEAICKGDPPAV